MAKPMPSGDFVRILRQEGVSVVEVGAWRTHNRDRIGAWGPVNGVMIHHTVTRGTQRTVEICRDGYAGLPGPLCHGVIAKDGTVHLIGYGRTNHAGSGDKTVLAAVMRESATRPRPTSNNTDGNARFYGFECENMGDGKDPWPDEQLDAIERVSAAVCRFHKWNEQSVIGHLEWRSGKIDPRGFTMNLMRTRIAARLAGGNTYTVVRGDTLTAIAERFKTTVNDLVKVNKLTNPDLIIPGQPLEIPRSTVTAPPAASKPKIPAFPGRQFFVLGANNAHARRLQEWLHKGNWGPRYKVGPSTRMNPIDMQKVAALQRHYLRDLGPADGLTGPKTWQYAFEVASGLRKK